MRTLLILGCILFIGCAKKGDSSTTPSLDLSGTYKIQDIECYQPDMIHLYSYSPFVGLYNDTLIISGNSLTEFLQTAGCVLNIYSTIAVSTSGVTITSAKSKNLSSSPCTLTGTLLGGSIIPNVVNTTYVEGGTINYAPNIQYLWNATNKTLGIMTSYQYQNGAQTGNLCYATYLKQ